MPLCENKYGRQDTHFYKDRDMTEKSWYYAKDDKSVGPIPESRMREMFRNGNLSLQTLVWSHPMPNWIPASNVEFLLMGTTSSQVPLKQTIKVSKENHPNGIRRKKELETPESGHAFGGQNYYYVKDPTSLTKFLKTMLWIFLGINVLYLISDSMQMNLLRSGSFSQAQAESNDARQQIMNFLYLGVFVLTSISFLKWKYRANLNCHGFCAQGMKFSPGWSIGYYFIPILGFFRPYQAMKEIWKVSKNPSSWQNETTSPLLGLWWALWLIGCFLEQASFRMAMSANTISSLQASTSGSIISGIINIPLCIIAVLIVSGIYAKQETLIRKHNK